MVTRRTFNQIAALSALRLKAVADEPTLWSSEMQADRLLIHHNHQQIATYVFNDITISRPYFMDLYTMGGTRITRHNPPEPNMEAGDHATMHPGLWLAFGRLNGEDYWRNKARIHHVRFIKSPEVKSNQISFSVLNTYYSRDMKKPLLNEVSKFRWTSWAGGVMLDWNSTITSLSDALKLGQQEEMGLGVRLSTPLCVKNGRGQINNSEAGINESGTWGKEALWWAATMPSTGSPDDGLKTGIQIIAQSSNVLKFWGHTRDYGLIVANPTPRPDQKQDMIELDAHKSLKMQFRVLLFDHIKPELEKWGELKLADEADF